MTITLPSILTGIKTGFVDIGSQSKGPQVGYAYITAPANSSRARVFAQAIGTNSTTPPAPDQYSVRIDTATINNNKLEITFVLSRLDTGNSSDGWGMNLGVSFLAFFYSGTAEDEMLSV